MWSFLRYVPPPVLRFVKRHTSSELRFRVRQRLGADYRNIGERMHVTADGRRIRLHPDPAYWALAHGLEYEPEITAAFRAILRPGDVAVDVGANYGWFASLFARGVGPRGRVLAFEPVPTTFARLRETLSDNGLGEELVLAEQAAVSASAGTATMYTFADHSGSSSMSSLGASDYDTVSVPTITLADRCASLGVDRIDVLKCDVEGAELDVLRGAEPLLRAPDGPIVGIELNGETLSAFGLTKTEVVAWLRERGYTLFVDVTAAGGAARVRTDADIEATEFLLAAPPVKARERVEPWLATSART